jgi:hypothetical protein
MNATTVRLVAGGALITIAAATSAAWADTSDAARYWQQHAQAERALILSWKRGDWDALNAAAFALSKSEIYLAAEGYVTPDDPRLVGRLAAEPGRQVRSQYDLPAFAYAVFQQELERQVGFRPQVGSLLSGNVFDVRARQPR